MTDNTTSIDSKATENPADHQPPPGAETSATWTATDGSALDYTASASFGADDGEERSVTFVFNGGRAQAASRKR